MAMRQIVAPRRWRARDHNAADVRRPRAEPAIQPRAEAGCAHSRPGAKAGRPATASNAHTAAEERPGTIATMTSISHGPAGRDPLAELIRYNARFMGEGRDPRWLRSKLDRLCASPFGFLRGTFHLFVADCAVVFDVNDFDETGPGSPALDLGRIATSIVLADARHSDARAVERIGRLIEAWRSAAGSLDLRPIGARETPAEVRHLIAAADDASRATWLGKRIELVGGQRRFIQSEKYQRIEDERLRAAITAAVHEFGARCVDRPDVADWPHVIDVATRVAGTGSLGRFRWAVLVQGKSERPGKERILELKESLPSSLAPDESGHAAERVIATQRRLQGA